MFSKTVVLIFPAEETVIAVPYGSRSARITVKGPAHLGMYDYEHLYAGQEEGTCYLPDSLPH